MTVFKTAHGRAAPVGRKVMDVRSGRVSCTHVWRGRRSRRSEISSSGEVWEGTTRSGFVGLAAAVLTLSFRGGRVACGGALSCMLGCLLCNSRLRFFPLDTAPVVRSVVSPAATALRLFLRGRAPTGDVGAATFDAPGRVSAVTLRVSKALTAPALQWAFWGQVRLHRHSQSAECGE
jgi:hypothetical protein